ncbi:hypothetical protein D521_0266 [beta proteobacterium CB]|nr:hypothetical protein D521_0266 [beta proteobacterium CB]
MFVFLTDPGGMLGMGYFPRPYQEETGFRWVPVVRKAGY